MSTIASMVYEVDAEGTSVNSLAALLSTPPVPQDVLGFFGAVLIADVTTKTGTSATRTVQARFASSPSATFSPAVVDSNGHLVSVAVSTAGEGYSGVPLVQVATANEPIRKATLSAILEVVGYAVVQSGSGYLAPTVRFEGGLAPPQVDPKTGFFPPSCMQGITIVSGGRNYSSNAVIEFQADLAPGGHLPLATGTFSSTGQLLSVLVTDAGAGMISPLVASVWDPGPTSNGSGGGTGAKLAAGMGAGTPATATVTLGGGLVTGLTITSDGGPYVALPTITISDTAGTGAVVTPSMGISAIDVANGGEGYSGTVTVTVEDLFFVLFQDASQWPSVFADLMTTPLQASVMSPVTAQTPTIS